MPATRTSIKQRLHDLGETDSSKSTVFFEKALTKACCSLFSVALHSKGLKTDLAQPQLCSRLLQEKDGKRHGKPSKALRCEEQLGTCGEGKAYLQRRLAKFQRLADSAS